MEHEPLPPKLEVQEITARLISACQRYTELTGKYIYIDVYPISPEFKETNTYTYEMAELKSGQ